MTPSIRSRLDKLERNTATTEAVKQIEYQDLPFMVDVGLTLEKARVAAQVRQKHLAKHERTDPTTDYVLSRLVSLEGEIKGVYKKAIHDHPAYPWLKKVKGVGDENIAKVVGFIRVAPKQDDEGKTIPYAPTISALWQFAGFGKDSDGKTQKRRKGKTNTFCSQLRVMCYRLVTSLMRAKGPYYDYYLKCKDEYTQRFIKEGKTVVPAPQLPKVDGKHVETDDYISAGHIDNMAKRKMIKLFLSHLWLEWRKGLGLPVSDPWVVATDEHPTHTHVIDPWEMV